MLHRTTTANLWLGYSHYKCKKKFYNVNVLHCCRLRFIVLNSVNRSLRRSSTYHIHCRMTTFCILSYYWMSFLYLEQSWIPNHQAIVSLLESLFSMLYVDQGLLILFQNQLRFEAPEMVLMNNFPWLNKLHEASKLAIALRHAILRESMAVGQYLKTFNYHVSSPIMALSTTPSFRTKNQKLGWRAASVQEVWHGAWKTQICV